jgi:EF-P beta-lysylation protein EpmB
VRIKAAYDTLKPMRISRWQTDLKSTIHKYQDLMSVCGLKTGTSKAPTNAENNFSVKVPRPFLSRINPDDPFDPLLRQVLPLPEENMVATGYRLDSVGEFNKHITPGLIKKYHGRALLITTASCALHCRYCFRRHYPYQENLAGQDNWSQAISILRDDNEIFEIILSGGDPLSLTDEKLEKLICQLEDISHLKLLRIHTRFPVAVPTRVTEQLLDMLCKTRFKTAMVLHINHPNEIDDEVKIALRRLHATGIHLLNQSVLLKGVNDHADILLKLSETLYQNHVLPYYLHFLDPVQGATHFEVDENHGKLLLEQLRSRLPGYLVPRLVREVADMPYKLPL